jgi:hypothetical protein
MTHPTDSETRFAQRVWEALNEAMEDGVCLHYCCIALLDAFGKVTKHPDFDVAEIHFRVDDAEISVQIKQTDLPALPTGPLH